MKMDGMTDSRREFHKRERKLSRLLGPYEKWIIKIQDCFSWDSPAMTISTLWIIHYIFWSIFMYGLRLYFIIPSVALLLIIVDTWRNQIWPEIRLPPLYEEDTEDWTPVSPKAMSVPEISWHLAKIWCFVTKRLKLLKKQRLDSPLLFVMQLTVIFSCTGVIGLYISGLMLSYVCIMMLFAWSGIQYLNLNNLAVIKCTELKDKFRSVLPAFIRDFFQRCGDLNRSGIDEFLPEANTAAMSALSDALQEEDKDMRASEERMLPTTSKILDLDLDLDFSHSQVSDNSVNLTMRETLLEQGLPSAFPGHEDLTDDELDKVYPDILPDDGDDVDIKFMPAHYNGKPTDNVAPSYSESDDLNYNIASVLASGLQAIGSSVASAAVGLEKHYRPQQPPPIIRVNQGQGDREFDPDSEEFVFLESPGNAE